MNDELTITIERTAHGQPRAYADHEYGATITIEGTKAWNRADEKKVRELARMFVHGWVEEGEGDWASARLDHLTLVSKELLSEDKLGPHREVWEVLITRRYTG